MSIADQLRPIVEDRGKEIRDKAADDLDRALRESAEPHKKTGELEAGISVTTADLGEILRATARSESPQGDYLEEGTVPHRIEPRDPAGVLVFEIDGMVIFSKHVQHPGTTATLWWSSVVERWSEFLEGAM